MRSKRASSRHAHERGGSGDGEEQGTGEVIEKAGQRQKMQGSKSDVMTREHLLCTTTLDLHFRYTGGAMFIFGNVILGIAKVLDVVLNIYMWVIIIRALISWVNPDPYNPIVQILTRMTEPILRPIRKLGPALQDGNRPVAPDRGPDHHFSAVCADQYSVPASHIRWDSSDERIPRRRRQLL